MVVGCPGSGKSTLSRQIGKMKNIPVLHLDYIYHIDNLTHISKQELKDMIQIFTLNNEEFIIDGNYGSTMEWRMQFCDTVILLDMDTDTCINNIKKRMNSDYQDDMADGFDRSQEDPEFLDFVKNFKSDKLPRIKRRLEESNLAYILLESEEDIESFIQEIKRQSN